MVPDVAPKMTSKTCDSVGNARKPPQSVRLPLTHTPKAKPVKQPRPLAPNTFNAKLRGELVEMMFMLQASLRGLIVAKPYGDSRRYDFITDTGRRLCRVQVKSSARRSGNGFVVNATSRRHSREIYTAADIDFLIAYIIPRNAWYIVPVTALHAASFMVYPDGCRRGAPYARYDQYRQAWPLLGASAPIPGFDTPLTNQLLRSS
jgi:hypothetical protein